MHQVLHSIPTLIKALNSLLGLTCGNQNLQTNFFFFLSVIRRCTRSIQLALLKIGQDPNTQDPAIIKQAYEELLKLRPNVLSFNSDNPANSFISGEVEVGQLWNGSVRIAKKEKAPLDMVFPKEGPVLWVDTLAIPKTAKNPDGAHKLINYMLGAKAAEKLTLAIGYPTANLEAKKHYQKK